MLHTVWISLYIVFLNLSSSAKIEGTSKNTIVKNRGRNILIRSSNCANLFLFLLCLLIQNQMVYIIGYMADKCSYNIGYSRLCDDICFCASGIASWTYFQTISQVSISDLKSHEKLGRVRVRSPSIMLWSVCEPRPTKNTVLYAEIDISACETHRKFNHCIRLILTLWLIAHIHTVLV